VTLCRALHTKQDGSVDQGTLREVSVLRMLRAENAHAFVMQIHDLYISHVDDAVCMVMPKAIGTINDIIENTLRLEKAGGKVFVVLSCRVVLFVL
jgi:hypothetical protein